MLILRYRFLFFGALAVAHHFFVSSRDCWILLDSSSFRDFKVWVLHRGFSKNFFWVFFDTIPPKCKPSLCFFWSHDLIASCPSFQQHHVVLLQKLRLIAERFDGEMSSANGKYNRLVCLFKRQGLYEHSVVLKLWKRK